VNEEATGDFSVYFTSYTLSTKNYHLHLFLRGGIDICMQGVFTSFRIFKDIDIYIYMYMFNSGILRYIYATSSLSLLKKSSEMTSHSLKSGQI